MLAFEKTYQDSIDSGILAGVAISAESRDGNFKYRNAFGSLSLRPTRSDLPMQPDTVLWIASCTKLMTTIAALQCVERGLVGLDDDIASVLPEVEKYGVLTGFDESIGEPNLISKKSAITLRRLMSHTSGYEYDIVNPLLARWRATLGKQPWEGMTIEEKATMPLVFEPGTSWIYGPGVDWVGKAIERVTGQTLETFMATNIWNPLMMKDVTFFPNQQAELKDRVADLSTLDPSGGKLYGGGGVYASADAFMLLLRAVLCEDSKLLATNSWKEFFKPQLDEQCTEALQRVLGDPSTESFYSMNLPATGKKNFSFAGLLSEDEYPGWMSEGTLLWAGAPCATWFVDRKAGICGFAGAQMMPPMAPPIVKLHGNFHREIFALAKSNKVGGVDLQSSV